MCLFPFGFVIGLIVGALIGWWNMRAYHRQVKELLQGDKVTVTTRRTAKH